MSDARIRFTPFKHPDTVYWLPPELSQINVISIDPGAETGMTFYGLVNDGGRSTVVSGTSVRITWSAYPVEAREVSDALGTVCRKVGIGLDFMPWHYAAEKMAAPQVFRMDLPAHRKQKMADAVMLVAQLEGQIYQELYRHYTLLPPARYLPADWRDIIGANGRTKSDIAKRMAVRWFEAQFGIKVPHHEAEAAAIGYYHLREVSRADKQQRLGLTEEELASAAKRSRRRR